MGVDPSPYGLYPGVVRNPKKLRVWHSARSLAVVVFDATASFPADELCGLTSQSRRAATSVVANIAEGCGRGTPGEFVRFLRIAAGSATALGSLLLLACDLGILSEADLGRLSRQASHTRRMLITLINRVAADSANSSSGS